MVINADGAVIQVCIYIALGLLVGCAIWRVFEEYSSVLVGFPSIVTPRSLYPIVLSPLLYPPSLPPSLSLPPYLPLPPSLPTSLPFLPPLPPSLPPSLSSLLVTYRMTSTQQWWYWAWFRAAES